MTERRRLTDEELRQLEVTLGGAGVSVGSVTLSRVLGELRRHRAILERLKDEGCPWRTKAGRHVCAYCEGPEQASAPGAEPEYEHAADCLWLEIEGA